ncbi:hypothetical protein HDU91_002837, partial [Kappamyces sp. JEL0680]
MIFEDISPLIFCSFLFSIFVVFFTNSNLLLHSAATTTQFVLSTEDGTTRKTLAQLVAEECPSLRQNHRFFSHPFLLFSGHAHTIWSSLQGFVQGPGSHRIAYSRTLIDTKDGGEIVLDWSELPSTPEDDRMYLFILHGMTGRSTDHYLVDLVLEAQRQGIPSVVMNFRGNSVSPPLKTAKLYSASSWQDIDCSLAYIRTRYPRLSFFGVGFSLGANVLTKYCGVNGNRVPFLGMASIANPYCLLGCSRLLHKTWIGKYLYSRRMSSQSAKLVKDQFNIFAAVVGESFNALGVEHAKSIIEFDQYLTVPTWKYKTVHEYYRFASCTQDIPYITIPSLFVTALDDPVSHREVIPYHEIGVNPNCILATTPHGGHLGFFAAKWDSFLPKSRWFPVPVMEFVQLIKK